MKSDGPYNAPFDIVEQEDIATSRSRRSSDCVTDEHEEHRSDERASHRKIASKLASGMSSDRVSGVKYTEDTTGLRGDSDSGSSDEDEDEDEENNTPEVVEGAYNPADYEHLNVSPEIKELFEYIQRYTPQTIELETHLRPFVPDYIAAVGDIDAFLKVPRPDGMPDNLGLHVLDEPCAKQSDPTVLDLHLRTLSKQSAARQLVVRSIENADECPKAINNWIKSISDLHRAKPPPTVHYLRNMPEISALMAEWPAKVEDALRILRLPSSELDCTLKDYIDILCVQ
ncbi:unnamed protein product [Dicrocoelium dendriticum]|nr:unnamed protein product [Dicrocoelium dendriticum]